MHNLDTDDEELQCAGVGHDLFEDTKTTEEDLRAAVAIEEKQEISDKNGFIKSDMKSARDFFKKLEARAADKGVYLTVDATGELEKLFKEAYYDGYQAAVDSVKSIQICGVTPDSFGAYKKMIVDILETTSNILKSSSQK